MAAGFQSAAEFRFYEGERAESGGARLRLRHRRESWVRRRCESFERCLAAVLGGAESVRVGALGLAGKPVGVNNTEVIGRIGTESDGAIGEPAINSECKHEAIIAQRQHTAIKSECQHATIVAE
jgi:hypothetical protein